MIALREGRAAMQPAAARTGLHALCAALPGRVAFAAVLLVLGISFLSASVAGLILGVVLPPRLRASCGRSIMRRGFQFCIGLMQSTGFCQFDLSELDALHNARGLMIAPNHPTLLDVVLIVSRVPNVVCVTKSSLWNNPLLGGMVRLSGFIRNDAALPLVRKAAAELHRGSNLLIFPEGTRTPAGSSIGRFMPGFAVMAKAGRAPVQTVFLDARTPYLRKGWSVLRQPPLPLVYRARLGERFTVDGQLVAPFVARLEQYFEAELALVLAG